MIGMKGGEPIGQHLGEDEHVDQSPSWTIIYNRVIVMKTSEEGDVRTKLAILHALSRGVCVDSFRDILTCGTAWGEVGETDRKPGDQVVKQSRNEQAVNSLISELGLGSSEQGLVSVESCNNWVILFLIASCG